jgi:hypothetical protein
MRNVYIFLKSVKGTDHLEDLAMNWMIFKKIGWDGVDWIHQAHYRDLRQVLVYGNKPLGSIKDREFLD